MSRDDKSEYYDAGGIEVLDIVKAKLDTVQYQGYLLGNALKYLLRSNFKQDSKRDIEKASNYLTFLLETYD